MNFDLFLILNPFLNLATRHSPLATRHSPLATLIEVFAIRFFEIQADI